MAADSDDSSAHLGRPSEPFRDSAGDSPTPPDSSSNGDHPQVKRRVALDRTQRDDGEPFRRLDASPAEVSKSEDWDVQRAAEVYGIPAWSSGYFGVSENGRLHVSAPLFDSLGPSGQQPDDRSRVRVDMLDIVRRLEDRGLTTPLMLRLDNLLQDRVQRINLAFQSAMELIGYTGGYRGVFPLKVNQQQHVVEQLTKFGEDYGHGLEVGSKAELLIAMSSLRPVDGLIICNGYKDRAFIDLGLQAIRLGFQCFFVIESPDELERVIECSTKWQVEPLIGFRIKLSTKVDGHWNHDSGDRSLFGLTTIQLIELIDRLRQQGLLHCLQLLHFHLGSQIPNIRNIRDGVDEACRYYIDLFKEGANLKYLDLGGGLAVDYDGSSSTHSHSRNYDLNEYCVDIVDAIFDALSPAGVEHPTLITESGRWTTAPMSVLIFNVLGVDHFEPTPDLEVDPKADSCEPIQLLQETLQAIKTRRIQENYNDAIYYRDQARRAFRSGKISLREKAIAENLCLKILNLIADEVPNLNRAPEELLTLRDSLSDIYFGNFSVFQSLPDAWAIDQVFPVVPLQRLHERPDRNGIIADLTCDCDGKLDQFGAKNGNKPTLPLHSLNADEEYLVGVFLVGAYQETLGDLHNLFGDNNVATVKIANDGHLEVFHEVKGDSIADVLKYVEYQPDRLYERFQEAAASAVSENRIDAEQRQQMLQLFADGLKGFTYFEHEQR